MREGRAPAKRTKSRATVRPVAPADAAAWVRMRQALWPEETDGEHAREIEAFFGGRLPEPSAVLVAESGGSLAGVVELSIRPDAEGCRTNRVAYLEGWYVEPSGRRRGIGRALGAAALEWGRAQGCVEFGSDALADNEVSTLAHRALGFEEVDVIRVFRKDL